MGYMPYIWAGIALVAMLREWSDAAFYGACIMAAIYSVGAEILDRLPTNERTTRG